jgi:hypothetical protein
LGNFLNQVLIVYLKFESPEFKRNIFAEKSPQIVTSSTLGAFNFSDTSGGRRFITLHPGTNPTIFEFTATTSAL